MSRINKILNNLNEGIYNAKTEEDLIKTKLEPIAHTGYSGGDAGIGIRFNPLKSYEDLEFVRWV